MKFVATLDRITLDDMIAMEERSLVGVKNMLAKFVQNGSGEYVAQQDPKDPDEWDEETMGEALAMVGKMSFGTLIEQQDEIAAQIDALTEEVTGGKK
jgi:hypothetical protein